MLWSLDDNLLFEYSKEQTPIKRLQTRSTKIEHSYSIRLLNQFIFLMCYVLVARVNTSKLESELDLLLYSEVGIG